MATVTLCPTKAGHGYKVVVGETWFYTSLSEFFRMINGKAGACKFRTIDDTTSPCEVVL